MSLVTDLVPEMKIYFQYTYLIAQDTGTIKAQNNNLEIPPQCSCIFSVLIPDRDWIAVEKLTLFCFWVKVVF